MISHSQSSPAGAKRSVCHSVCYAFLQGKCTKGKDCKYDHHKKALAVVKSSVKAAAAPSRDSPENTPRNPKPKSDPLPKPKASAVALVVHSDDESGNEYSVRMYQPFQNQEMGVWDMAKGGTRSRRI